MGMTNRVIRAQGEERGASFTLIRLDGDTSRKFQSQHQQILKKIVRGVAKRETSGMEGILPQISGICS
jgi:hypothetical protein